MSVILAPAAVLFSMPRQAAAPSSVEGSTTPNTTATAMAAGVTSVAKTTTSDRIGIAKSTRKPCHFDSSAATSCVRPAACALDPNCMTAAPKPDASSPETNSMSAVRKASRP